MVCRFLYSLSFLLCLLVTGCLPVFSGNEGSSAPGPQGNGEGFQGVIATVENSAPRCGITGEGLRQKVTCVVVVRDGKGNEWEATEIEKNVELGWREPKLIEGTKVRSIECLENTSHLSQTCDVNLSVNSSEKSPTFEFGFDVSQEPKAPVAKTITLSLLTAETYGIVPHVPTFNPVLNSEETRSRKVGFEVEEFNPLEEHSGSPSSVCKLGNRTYIATLSSVFLKEGDSKTVRLYAGNSNAANSNNLASRLDVNIWNGQPMLRIACSKAGLVVVDAAKNRILLVKDEGPVDVLYQKPSVDFQGITSASNAEEIYVLTFEFVIRINTAARKVEEIPFSPALTPYSAQGHFSYIAVSYPSLFASTTHQVFKIDLEQGSSSPFAGSTASGSFSNGVPALQTKFNIIKGLLIDEERQVLLVSDSGNNAIRSISLKTNTGETLLGKSGFPYPGCDLVAFPANLKDLGLCRPMWLAKDTDKSLLLINDSKVLKVTLEGVGTPVFGKVSGTLADNSKDLSRIRMGVSYGVAFLKNTLVASDLFADALRHIYPQNNEVVSRFSETGIDGPREVRALKDGSYVVLSSKAIHKVSAEGKISLLLAHNPNGILQDQMTVQQFKFKERDRYSYAGGLAVHTNGTLYFADDSVIYALIPGDSPKVVRIAGSFSGSGYGYSGDGGQAVDALLRGPTGMDIGPDNALYFGDAGNHAIRKINLSTGIIETIATGTDAVALSLRVRKNGSLYITQGTGQLNIFVPRISEGGAPSYQLTKLFESSPKGQCSGQIRAPGTKDASLSSLDTLCRARLVGLDLRDSCEETNGKLEIAYTQTFDSFPNQGFQPAAGNVVRLSLPCHLAK